MEMCCSVCQLGGPNEYDAYQQSDEECPLTREQSTNCRTTACTWKLRILTCFLTIFTLLMMAYLIYLQSLLGLSVRELVDHGAVAADNINCSKIGTDVLKEGGNAVDAAVASVLCMTVIAPYKTGLGGGGIAMIHNNREEEAEPLVIDFATNTIAGVLATAKVRVPSIIRGLEFLHNLKGHLAWQRIVEPAEKLAKDGFFITRRFMEEISKVPDHSMIFGYLAPEEILKLPHLGETLEAIKNHGSQIFYNGSLVQKVLRDEFDEIHDDVHFQLANYEPIKTKGRKLHFYNHVIYTPEHSELFHSTLKKIESLNISMEESSSIEAQLEIARALIQIKNDEGENFEQERYTAVVAADSDNNFVSIITGLSTPLGLGHMTGAGFLLDSIHTNNNLQLLTPVIFHQHKNPQEYSGILGLDDHILGGEILSDLILRHANLSTAIETQRYYNVPDGILLEPSEGKFQLNEAVVSEISGFNNHRSLPDISQYSKSVNGIIKERGMLSSHSDSRGGGIASRYK